MKIFLPTIFLVTACSSAYKIPSHKYDDKIISTSQNSNGTTTYKFYRHDLVYIDTANKHKLLDRKVYDGDQLVYRYPVLKVNVRPSKIFLKSGNSFLDKSKVDTVMFINNDLPAMNRLLWGKGVIITKLTENAYRIKASPDNTGFARIYISTTHNYEEIENDNGFIADSLVLQVK